MSRKPLLSVGYVSRAHGIRGEIAVRTYDPDSTALRDVNSLVLATPKGPELRRSILSRRKAAKEWLLELDGVGDRTAAETFKSAQVFIDRDALPPPEPGEFFQGDLVGLRVRTPAGLALGIVELIAPTGPVPNLVVRTPSGDELWLPFAEPFVSDVDLEKGELVATPPEEEGA